MKVDALRKTYLDFFGSKDHKVFPSDSLVPVGDPSVLFTGAGMNQFKPYFLGLKKEVKRATSCQKCLRTADLERVGKTAYHHSFFEMLGNFSFGDYFKDEAIAWGWEFVTKALAIPTSKLWVSVYEEDDEAFDIWKDKIGVPQSRIVRMGPEDNFWPSNARIDGPNGPCGPCSEIYVGEVPGKGVEIWNLVFTQFDRQPDATLKALPMKNIDTGMGLERSASVLQGVESNFDIDTFQVIRKEIWMSLKKGGMHVSHENAVMDHLRAVVFSVADGVVPSNEGRGYVIRKLIRLGSEHLEKAGAVKPGLLHSFVPAIVGVMRSAYPELEARREEVTRVIRNEEMNYLEVLRTRIPKLETELLQSKTSGAGSISVARIAFIYHDTYGVPFEKSQEIASKLGTIIDRKAFDELLEQQRRQSREGSKIAGDIFKKEEAQDLIQGLAHTKFLGYEQLEASARLLKKSADDSVLIFDQTPFYAESGGQIGDTGCIVSEDFEAEVVDTQGLEKCVLHKIKIKKGHPQENHVYRLAVDTARRGDIMKNHTATHLLHAALRKVLGGHVKQAGSLVSADYLRFDFNHTGAVDAATLASVEALVNEKIASDTPLQKKVMGKDQAVQEGAVAFFGEKYGDQVRVVSVGDFSKELCGGTHLQRTGEIGSFIIVSEGSIQAGVRRIEAVTGRAADELRSAQRNELEALEKAFGAGQGSLEVGLKVFSDRLLDLKNRLTVAATRRVQERVSSLVNKSSEILGAKIVVEVMDGADADLLKAASDHLKGSAGNYAALFVSERDQKVTFAVTGSPTLVKKGFQSGNIVKNISKIVEGNGGGRPDFAIGGGKNLLKKEEAIKAGRLEIEAQIRAAS